MKNCRGQLLMLQNFLYGAPTIQKFWICHCDRHSFFSSINTVFKICPPTSMRQM